MFRRATLGCGRFPKAGTSEAARLAGSGLLRPTHQDSRCEENVRRYVGVLNKE
jgi:hypothetical protein